ncbi:MAG: histidinol-phosphate transaminase [Candidatus Nanopelagicales bacterium]
MTAPQRLPIRPGLAGEAPYGAPTDPVPVRLNVNENPYPPSPEVAAAMGAAVADAVADVNRYPDREARALRDALAATLEVTGDQVWAANGSNEVMAQILGAFGGPDRTMVSFAPTYSMYPVYARDSHTRYVTAPRAADHTLDPAVVAATIAAERPSVVVIASPNNPTGGLLTREQVVTVHDLVAPDGVLVVDEAYVEFAGPGASVVPLLTELPHLIVLRTMSKAWGLAGLRLGYAVTSPDIVDALRIVRLPYHLSALTQAAAVAAVAHRGQLLAPVAHVVAEREALQDWLAEQGIPFSPSQANFVLLGPLPDAPAVFARMKREGVLIRESGGPGHLRASIGTPDENAALRMALLSALEGEA